MSRVYFRKLKWGENKEKVDFNIHWTLVYNLFIVSDFNIILSYQKLFRIMLFHVPQTFIYNLQDWCPWLFSVLLILYWRKSKILHHAINPVFKRYSRMRQTKKYFVRNLGGERPYLLGCFMMAWWVARLASSQLHSWLWPWTGISRMEPKTARLLFPFLGLESVLPTFQAPLCFLQILQYILAVGTQKHTLEKTWECLSYTKVYIQY